MYTCFSIAVDIMIIISSTTPIHFYNTTWSEPLISTLINVCSSISSVQQKMHFIKFYTSFVSSCFDGLNIKDINCDVDNSVHQRCQPGTTPISKIMTKNPYNLQRNPYKLSTPLQNTILV